MAGAFIIGAMRKKLLIRMLAALCSASLCLTPAAALIPASGGSALADGPQPPISFAAFAKEVSNGNAEQLVGLYAETLFALPVVQQPESEPAFVSLEPEKATQFTPSAQYGSTGLIAHNNLAGAHFFDLGIGDQLTLVYGDGHEKGYTITQIERFQALTPASPYSQFAAADGTPGSLSAEDLFKMIYEVKGRLILQTCIARGGQASWGRLFVIAEPTRPLPAD